MASGANRSIHLEELEDEDCKIVEGPLLRRQYLKYKFSWIDDSGCLILALVSQNSFLENGQEIIKTYKEIWKKKANENKWILMCRN